MSNLHIVLMVHLVNDGCGAAHRLVAEEYRGHGLNSTQLMMVDDLLDVRVLQTIYRLAFSRYGLPG